MSADVTAEKHLQSDKHRQKMERRKQVQDERLAQMTDKKGLVSTV